MSFFNYNKPFEGRFSIYSVIAKLALTIVFLIFMATIFFYVKHNLYPVMGTCMIPNIEPEGRAVFVDLDADYERGDILVAYNNFNSRMCKRVVALGGDKFGVIFNSQTGFYDVVLWKNGEEAPEVLHEEYLIDKSLNYYLHDNLYNWYLQYKTFEDVEFEGQTYQFLVVPEDSIFMIGDNRKDSYDCADYGPLKAKYVMGKVDLIVKEDAFHVLDVMAYLIGLRGTFE